MSHQANEAKTRLLSLKRKFTSVWRRMKTEKDYIDFAGYQRKVLNHMGYFFMSRTQVGFNTENNYFLESTCLTEQIIYWGFYLNTLTKAMFLTLLIFGYFGHVVFLDKIVALDYILCVGIVAFGSCIWFLRYPFYEILHSFWKIENSIFNSLGRPEDLKGLVDKRHFATVWIHVCIVWGGCFILLTQFYADPKYCLWTYSSFELDNWYLRLIFCLHEVCFMAHPWHNMTVSSGMCSFQGIALSNIIDRMTNSVESLTLTNLPPIWKYNQKQEYIVRNERQGNSKIATSDNELQSLNSTDFKGVVYDIEKIIFDYKQLIIISDQFNSWVSYKLVFLHACGYCQFISDVFVGLQILKLPGTGIVDVWFFIEDSLASMYVIYRVYKFLSRVAPASEFFLRSLNLYLSQNKLERMKRKQLRRVTKTLRVVSLKLGPCQVTPMTVIKALEMLGNYYITVALWN